MQRIKEGLVTTFYTVTGSVIGALGGLLGQLYVDPRCINVDVPPLRPDISVETTFDEVHIERALQEEECSQTIFGQTIQHFCYAFNRSVAIDELNHIQHEVDARVGRFRPDTSIEDCVQYMPHGAAIGAAVVLAVSGLYFLGRHICTRGREPDEELGRSRELEEVDSHSSNSASPPLSPSLRRYSSSYT